MSANATTIAFDRLAARYDALASGDLFRRMRQTTHAVFARRFAAGSRVLEIGCGTGLDTVFLAARCRHVVACDPSEEMVTQTLRRLAHGDLLARVTVMPCGLQDLRAYLEALAPPEPFDAIVSNFGALNCVRHLAPLGALACRHLRPGGVVLIGLMSRSCALEWLYFSARGRFRLATRRLGRGAVAVPVAGIDVPTFYHRIGDVRLALGHGFRLAGVTGIGVLTPPPYLEPRWQQLPPAIRALVRRVDRTLAGIPPLNRLGDHVLLQFVRERGDG